MLTDTSVGLLNPVYSGPSLFEVGESSLAGEGVSAQVPLTADLETGVSAWCTMSLLEADGLFYVESSSDEPSLPSGEADGPFLAGTSSDELTLSPGKANGPFYAGTSSDELTVSQDKADDPFSARISSVELSLLLGKVDDPFSFGTSSDEPTLPSGKSDKVFLRSSVECFLFDFFLSLSQAGLVVLGDNEGDEGGLDSFMPIAALEFEQPSLVELPTKALCVVLGASALVEEELNFSDMGLGGEDSSPIPLLSITPFGLPLLAELN